ncbi:hypothetical protein KUV51_11545 [Tateyamaria omphalii]|uniref:hypothetical protein n=1 Tax=Tateyamaria omphalii TaxID=299262 RepID=UPI001C98F3E8|nr:hypothetical protein [Tateyamaria omphalii]MBY5933635.1 hypothetical protein [Tateyamaria omphalii]
MDLIADILLAAGALGAGFYCFVLSRRLKRFNSLEKGVGGAVAMLSSQVDDLTKTLEAAQKTAAASAETLNDTTQRATEIARRLELQMAALHDVQAMQPSDPVQQAPQEKSEPIFTRRSAGVRQ